MPGEAPAETVMSREQGSRICSGASPQGTRQAQACHSGPWGMQELERGAEGALVDERTCWHRGTCPVEALPMDRLQHTALPGLERAAHRLVPAGATCSRGGALVAQIDQTCPA
ncbi:hypothetical protein HPB48_017104 [Haemaphysalis longicornis]|uniref:Uncharacterized protein n=1 Tax=Haemaphysalis longicornis TaxID=44386 RepID=A0A9J6GVP9_HAELO|nr:hypothetical protein HPB48_017104 [Haemaphysalis longicornis]